MSYSCACVIRVTLLSKLPLSPEKLWMDHGSVGESCLADESQFVIHHNNGCVRVSRIPCEQLFPPMYIRSYSGQCWWVWSLGDILDGVTWICGFGRTKNRLEKQHNLNTIAVQSHPYMESVLPTGNGAFQHNKAPCHKAQIVLEFVQKHNDEYQLM